MAKKILFISILILLIASCNICYWIPIEKLTYKDKLIFSNQIKIQGYYLDSSNKPMNNIYWTFYSNGLVNGYKGSKYDCDLSEYVYNGDKPWPWGWGYYFIENNIIKCQLVTAFGAHSFHKFPIKEEWCRIINDTTLLLFKEINHKGNEISLNDTLFFKSDKIKCDSNCIFLRCVEKWNKDKHSK